MKNLAVHRPRRFLVRIRSILVLILVLAFVLALTVEIVRNAKLQIDAVTAITSAGGRVYYDEGPWPENFVFSGCNAIRRWSSDRIGPDYFYPV